MSKVIYLFGDPDAPTCGGCAHFGMTMAGAGFCLANREEADLQDDASDCPDYEGA